MADKDERLYHFTESSPEDEAYLAHAAAEMTRAYRLRGRMIPLVGVLTSLLFFLTVPFWYRHFLGMTTPITVLVIGGMLMGLAIPCHILGGNRGFLAKHPTIRAVCYVLGILLNGVGTSLCMTAYYVHVEQAPDIGNTVAGLLVTAVLYALVCLLVQIWPKRYGIWTGSVSLVTLALIVVSIVFWVGNNQKVLPSFCFFSLLWTLITVIALHVSCSDEESPWLRFSSFASFGILMGVGAVVLLILACAGGGDCDCDCGDGCGECCDCGTGCDGCGGSAGDSAAKKPRRRRRRLGS